MAKMIFIHKNIAKTIWLIIKLNFITNYSINISGSMGTCQQRIWRDFKKRRDFIKIKTRQKSNSGK